MPERGGPVRPGLDPGLEAAGFNVAGVLTPARYDALVPPAWRCAALLPRARAVVVLGCGGRAFGRALRAALPVAHAGGPLPLTPPDPVERFSEQVVGAAASALRAAGCDARAAFSWQRRGGDFADFVALARACGCGAPSRLGLLLHPEYGPWLALRALLLSAQPLAPTPPLAGSPCDGCAAPCAVACHGRALPPAGFDAAACARTRLRDPRCALRCDARRACVVGPTHAYDAELEAHHMRHAPPPLPTAPN